MNKIVLLNLLLFTGSVFGQKNTKTNLPKAPKLVIGIVVDQMRYDFLYRYENKYGKGGFKRLMNEGFNCKNLHYNYGPTVTAAGHSAIYTGSVPNITGIIGNDWYDQKLNKTMYCTEDSTVKTVGSNSTAGKMSPKNMLVSTVTDQLRIANNFNSKTIGVALKDRGSILPAGHTANGAYWYDGTDGSWITSTFYMPELPKWVKDFNDKKPTDKYFNTAWTTLLPIEKYTESTADDQSFETKITGETKAVFPHNYLNNKTNFYELIKNTPYGNTLTKDFAMAAFENEQLGLGKLTDFLAISFSTPDYAGHAYGPNSVELEDIYIRLDKDLEEMLNTFDAKLGKNNYLVFLSADHGVADVPGFWQQNKLPAGVLTYMAAKNIANKNLKDKFGIDNLIESEDNNQFYLNDKLLKEQNLTVEQLFPIIKQAVLPIEGIADVINLHNLPASNIPEILKNRIVNGINAKRSGDIMLLSKPMYFAGRLTGTTHGSVYNYDTHVPALFFGWNVPQGESLKKYSISDIAPTISNMLNILEPSGNIGEPINFKN
jgi:predicted AlkP superfamily pyrophosphatase or phosphodiesterase